MAVKGSMSPHIINHQSNLFRKPLSRMVVLRKSQLPLKKSGTLQIRSYIKNQVFEDHSKGIICYKDDNGEIICEGFDEGPRFYPQSPVRAETILDCDVLQERFLDIWGEEASKNSRNLLELLWCNRFKF